MTMEKTRRMINVGAQGDGKSKMLRKFLVCVNEWVLGLFLERGNTRREAGWGGGSDDC